MYTQTGGESLLYLFLTLVLSFDDGEGTAQDAPTWRTSWAEERAGAGAQELPPKPPRLCLGTQGGRWYEQGASWTRHLQRGTRGESSRKLINGSRLRSWVEQLRSHHQSLSRRESRPCGQPGSPRTDGRQDADCSTEALVRAPVARTPQQLMKKQRVKEQMSNVR